MVLLRRLLSEAIGRYFEGVAPSSLELGHGQCILRNTRIRPEALEAAGLPFRIASCTVAELEVRFDWRADSWATFRLDGVQVVVSPFQTKEERRSAELNAKRRRLIAREAARFEKSRRNAAWTSRLLTHVLETARVEIGTLSVLLKIKDDLIDILADSLTVENRDPGKRVSVRGLCVELKESAASVATCLLQQCGFQVDLVLNANSLHPEHFSPSFNFKARNTQPGRVIFQHVCAENVAKVTYTIARLFDSTIAKDDQDFLMTNARERWKFACREVRRNVRRFLRWYSQDPKYVERRELRRKVYAQVLKESRPWQEPWLDSFELDCPLEILMGYHDRISLQRHEENQAISSIFPTWLTSIALAAEDGQETAGDHSVQDTVKGISYEEEASISVKGIEIEMEDEHGFELCKLLFDANLLWSMRKDSSKTLRFSVENFHVVVAEPGGGDLRELVVIRDAEEFNDENSDADGESFKDATSEPDDSSSSSSSSLSMDDINLFENSASSLIRVLYCSGERENGADEHRTSIIIEPIDIQWDLEIFSAIQPTASSIFDSFEVLFADMVGSEMRRNHSRSLSNSATTLRFGAPRILLRTGTLKFGSLSISNKAFSRIYELEFTGSTLVSASGKLLVGPVDVTGSLVDSVLAVDVSTCHVVVCREIFETVMSELGGVTPLPSKISYSLSPQKNHFLKMRRERSYDSSWMAKFQVRSPTIVFRSFSGDHEVLRLSVNSMDVDIAIFGVSFSGIRDVSFSLETIRACTASRDVLNIEQLMINHSCKKWKILVEEEFSFAWVPASMSELWRLLEFAGVSEASLAETMASTMHLHTSSTHRIRIPVSFVLELRKGFTAKFFKAETPPAFASLRLVSLDLRGFPSDSLSSFKIVGGSEAGLEFRDSQSLMMLSSPNPFDFTSVQKSSDLGVNRDFSAVFGKFFVRYWQPFWTEWFDYSATGVIDLFAHAVKESISEEWVKFEINLDKISSLLPRFEHSSAGLHLVLEKVKIRNTLNESLEDPLDIFITSFTKVKLHDASLPHLPYICDLADVDLVYNRAIRSGKTSMSLNLEEVVAKFSSEAIFLTKDVISSNLMNEQPFLSALLALDRDESSSGHQYWQHWINAKSKWHLSCVCILDLRITFLETLCFCVSKFETVSSSRFVPGSNQFYFETEYLLYAPVLDLAGFRILHAPSQSGQTLDGEVVLRIRHDPSNDLYTCSIGLTGLFAEIFPGVLEKTKQLMSDLPDIDGPDFSITSSSPVQGSKNINVELDVDECRWNWATSSTKNDWVAFDVKLLGNATNECSSASAHLQKAEGHLNIRVELPSWFEEAEMHRSLTPSHEADSSLMGMPMNESMLISSEEEASENSAMKRNSVVDSADLQIMLDLPSGGDQEIVRKIHVLLSSDLDIKLSRKDLECILRLFSDSDANGNIVGDEEFRSFDMSFSGDSLGLKLAYSDEQRCLEIRGFAKTCDETVTRLLRPGDLLTEVNGQMIVNIGPEKSKEFIRESGSPRLVTFKRQKRNQVWDPLLFLPLSSTSWTCRVCRSAQPASGREVLQCTCEQCGATHKQIAAGYHHMESPDAGTVVEDEMFENHRLYLLMGWSTQLLPGDPFSWSDRAGRRELGPPGDPRSAALPESHVQGATWSWLDDWRIDDTAGTGKNGWMYAKSFTDFLEAESDKKSTTRKRSSHVVRQRRWVRRRVLSHQKHDFHVVKTKQAQKVAAADEASEDEGLKLLFHSVVFETVENTVTVLIENLARLQVGSPEMASWVRLQSMSNDSVRIAGNLCLQCDVKDRSSLDWLPILEPWTVAFEFSQIEESWSVTTMGLGRMSVNAAPRVVEGLQNLFAGNSRGEVCLRNELGKTLTLRASSGNWVADIDNGETNLLPDDIDEPIELAVSGGWVATRTFTLRKIVESKIMSIEVFTFDGTNGVVILETLQERTFVARSRVVIMNASFTESFRLRLEGAMLLGSCGPGVTMAIPVVEKLHEQKLRLQNEAGTSSINLAEISEAVEFACKRNYALSLSEVGVHAMNRRLELSPICMVELAVNGRAVVNGKHCFQAILKLSPLAMIENGFRETSIETSLSSAEILPRTRLEFFNVTSIAVKGVRVRLPEISDNWSTPVNKKSSFVELKGDFGRSMYIPVVVDGTRIKFGPGLYLKNEIGFALQVAWESDKKRWFIPDAGSVGCIAIEENQRWLPVQGWTAPSLPHDPATWTSEAGVLWENFSGLQDVQLGKGWRWAEPEWQCDTQGNDWMYAPDFQSSSWKLDRSNLHYVRKRVWRKAVAREERSMEKEMLLGCVPEDESLTTTISFRFASSGVGGWSTSVPFKDNSSHLLQLANRKFGQRYPVLVGFRGEEVRIRPKFIAMNRDPFADIIIDCGGTSGHTFKLGVGSAEGQMLSWPLEDVRESHAFRLGCSSVDGSEEIYWSGLVDPNYLDDFVVQLRRRNDLGRVLKHISIVEDDPFEGVGTICITISSCDYSTHQPYRLENRTLHTLEMSQKCSYGEGLPRIVVKDRRTCVFGWEEMNSANPPQLEVRFVNETGKSQHLVLDLLQDIGIGKRDFSPSETNDNRVVARVYCEGPVRVVCISHAWAMLEPPLFVDEPLLRQIRCEFHAGILLSFLNDNEEVAVARIEGLEITTSKTVVMERISFGILFAQLDQQLDKSSKPITFASGGFSVQVAYFVKSMHNVKRFHQILIRCEPSLVYLDRMRYLKFARLFEDILEKFRRSKKSTTRQEQYFDLIYIHPLRVSLSLTRGGGASASSSASDPTRSVTAGDALEAAVMRIRDLDIRKAPYWAVALGHIFLSDLKDETVDLGDLNLNHVTAHNWEIPGIMQHYVLEIARSLTTSKLNFQARRVIPRGFVLHSKPSSSSSSSVLVSGAAISESFFGGLARGLATMSFSATYIEQRERAHSESKASSSEISKGFNMVKHGFSEGLVGLVSEPTKGASEGGTSGFLAGIGKGVTGAAVKPIVGVLDAAAFATGRLASASEMRNEEEHLDRIRLPRPLYGAQKVFRAYSLEDAEAQSLLQQVSPLYPGDFFLGQIQSSPETLHIFTTTRLLQVSNQHEVLWQVDLIDIQDAIIKSVPTWGIFLHFRKLVAGASAHFLTCPKGQLQAESALAMIET